MANNNANGRLVQRFDRQIDSIGANIKIRNSEYGRICYTERAPLLGGNRLAARYDVAANQKDS